MEVHTKDPERANRCQNEDFDTTIDRYHDYVTKIKRLSNNDIDTLSNSNTGFLTCESDGTWILDFVDCEDINTESINPDEPINGYYILKYKKVDDLVYLLKTKNKLTCDKCKRYLFDTFKYYIQEGLQINDYSSTPYITSKISTPTNLTFGGFPVSAGSYVWDMSKVPFPTGSTFSGLRSPPLTHPMNK